MRFWRFLLLACIACLPLLVTGCVEDRPIEVVRVAQPLPQQEEARYTLLDSKGATLGRATLSITPEGDDARVRVAYDFGERQRDTGSVLVRRATLAPLAAEREVLDGDKTYRTRATYAEKVTVAFEDGVRARTRDAAITDGSYDNIASVFLWRSIEHRPGVQYSYANIIVDPKHGTINRVLGTVEVERIEDIKVGNGVVRAWRVAFRSGGLTNTAWYRAEGDRALLRYEITRGPTLVLEP